MTNLSFEEACLLRLLTSFFGKDRIMVHLSVQSILGRKLPPGAAERVEREMGAAAESWARGVRCLFTIVDDDDNPKLVVEFHADVLTQADENGGPVEVVDVHALERQRCLKPVLEACDIRYITMTKAELDEIMTPSSGFDLYAFFRDKVMDW